VSISGPIKSKYESSVKAGITKLRYFHLFLSVPNALEPIPENRVVLNANLIGIFLGEILDK
jgi:hypothetical protein